MTGEKEKTGRSLQEILAHRKEKLQKIREMGINPYPYSYQITHHTREILEQFDKFGEEEIVSLAGRIMSIRRMGKASFAHILDSEGQIQVYIRKNEVGDKAYELFKLLDIGDIVGVKGRVFKTRTGEISIYVLSLELLSKNMYPLPVVKEKDGVLFDPFSDKEQRYRQRYIDLIVNPGVREIFRLRSRIIRFIRRYLDDAGFLEVETPILQPLYGGANARPFTTYHHTLGETLYLRIADELYLKRLIVGGFEKVYEISKNFRNEGMDRYHNPEFTALEFYQAYVDYEYMMDFVEKLFRELARELDKVVVEYEGIHLDFSQPFRRIPMLELFKQYTGLDVLDKKEEELLAYCKEAGIEVPEDSNYGQLLDKIFKVKVEPELQQPTFVIDYPRAISPFAKGKRGGDGRLVERFELFINGNEYVNAFSELNDPEDQRRRLEEQNRLREAGDQEAHVVDEDFLHAIEIGMPPTGGVGIGIDRLVMLFTGQTSIKDVIFFPQMRRE